MCAVQCLHSYAYLCEADTGGWEGLERTTFVFLYVIFYMV